MTGKTAEFSILNIDEIPIGETISLGIGQYVEMYNSKGGEYISIEEISSQPAPHASIFVYRK